MTIMMMMMMKKMNMNMMKKITMKMKMKMMKKIKMMMMMIMMMMIMMILMMILMMTMMMMMVMTVVLLSWLLRNMILYPVIVRFLLGPCECRELHGSNTIHDPTHPSLKDTHGWSGIDFFAGTNSPKKNTSSIGNGHTRFTQKLLLTLMWLLDKFSDGEQWILP